VERNYWTGFRGRNSVADSRFVRDIDVDSWQIDRWSERGPSVVTIERALADRMLALTASQPRSDGDVYASLPDAEPTITLSASVPFDSRIQLAYFSSRPIHYKSAVFD